MELKKVVHYLKQRGDWTNMLRSFDRVMDVDTKFSPSTEDIKREIGRERNRDHARRTRLRKRVALDGLKESIDQLQQEALLLQAEIEERDTASILLGLGVDSKPSHNAQGTPPPYFTSVGGSKILFLSNTAGNVITQLRLAVRMEAAARRRQAQIAAKREMEVSGNPSTAPAPQSLSPPSKEEPGVAETKESSEQTLSVLVEACAGEDEGADTDYDSSEEGDGEDDKHAGEANDSTQTSTENPEDSDNCPASVSKISRPTTDAMRKERNRIHARLTRDRKKLFTARMAELVDYMERHNQHLRKQLQLITGVATPAFSILNSSRLSSGPVNTGPNSRQTVQMRSLQPSQKAALEAARVATLQHQQQQLEQQQLLQLQQPLMQQYSQQALGMQPSLLAPLPLPPLQSGSTVPLMNPQMPYPDMSLMTHPMFSVPGLTQPPFLDMSLGAFGAPPGMWPTPLIMCPPPDGFMNMNMSMNMNMNMSMPADTAGGHFLFSYFPDGTNPFMYPGQPNIFIADN